MRPQTIIDQMAFPFAEPSKEDKRTITGFLQALDKICPEGAEMSECWFPASLVAGCLSVGRTRLSQLVEAGILREQKLFGHCFVHFGDALQFMRERKNGRPKKAA